MHHKQEGTKNSKGRHLILKEGPRFRRMRRKFEARLLEKEVKEDERKSKAKPSLERQSTTYISESIVPQTPLLHQRREIAVPAAAQLDLAIQRLSYQAISHLLASPTD